jgi:alginate O-acetyltransferase complex protein AlgI
MVGLEVSIIIGIDNGIGLPFKYSNFFIDSLFSLLGQDLPSDFHIMKIILPVGISFYTFQSIAYVIDVYRGEIKATRNILNYAAFISFFPQLVAGPIERARNLLPQIEGVRSFNYQNAVIGCRLILWGLFKKIMVADNAAGMVDTIFTNQSTASGLQLCTGIFLFGIQIYCDFSGYSEIARGTSKLLGIELMQNFNYPYFSRDIHQFWRRWHISLSTWFKDYVFIPLGGSKISMSQTILNTFIVFFISGLWHGANAKFIVWGIYHFLLYALYMLVKNLFPKYRLPNVLSCIVTLVFVMLGWIFFRANDLSSAFEILGKIAGIQFYAETGTPLLQVGFSTKLAAGICILIFVEFYNRNEEFGLRLLNVKSGLLRWFIYFILILILIIYGNFNEQKFIYFDF